jgi:magnesium chelatase family protein
VRPFSQLSTVQRLTPRRAASAFCVKRHSSRARRRRSPSVRGSVWSAFGFRHLSLTGTDGKKATRPCACGYLGDLSGRCRCTPDQIARYRGRISGPLADRIDLKVEVPRLRDAEMLGAAEGEATACVRARVCAARERQLERQANPNAWLGPKETLRHCAPDAQAERLLKEAVGKLSLSARAVHRILRVARTIADLASVNTISAAQAAEAIQYRRLDASF